MNQELVSQYGRVVFAAGASVPLGASAIVHTWGRNDMTLSQRMGFRWLVYAPYVGAKPPPTVNYTDWTMFGVAPGDVEERMTPRFDLNQPGEWTVLMELLMNPGDPVVVDTYEGLLCVVEGWAGTITKKELEYDGTRGAIPVY